MEQIKKEEIKFVNIMCFTLFQSSHFNCVLLRFRSFNIYFIYFFFDSPLTKNNMFQMEAKI